MEERLKIIKWVRKNLSGAPTLQVLFAHELPRLEQPFVPSLLFHIDFACFQVFQPGFKSDRS